MGQWGEGRKLFFAGGRFSFLCDSFLGFSISGDIGNLFSIPALSTHQLVLKSKKKIKQ